MEYPLMHPPFEIKSFEEMKKKEAQQHFEWYISEIPSRIQLLKRAYHFTTNRSEEELDLSSESLIRLWEWFLHDIVEVVDRTEEEIQKDLYETPRWLHADVRKVNKKLYVTSLSVSMDIGIYLAETLRKNNDLLYWGFKSIPKSLFCVNTPVLMHSKIKWELFDPAHMINVLDSKLLEGNFDINSLYKLFENEKNLIEEES